MNIFRFSIICILILCWSCKPPENIADKHTVYLHLQAEPDTLNPITATDAYSSRINSYIYESLLKRNEDTLELEPELAERWEISPDKKYFTFYIKKGVLWSDGKEFTADDVVYSYKKIMDPQTLCTHLKVYYKDIVACTKINKYTVQFTYAEPFFLALEYCGMMPIVPKHIFDDDTDFNTHKHNRHPIGTGPYKFRSWRTSSKIELELNELYRNEHPKIKRIVYKIIEESNVALQMLKKGDLDVMNLRDIQWERQTNSKKFNEQFYKLKYFTPNYNYIGWNSQREFFSDKRVRQAMTMLINREEILQKLLFGNGKQVTGTFYIFSKYYNNDIDPLPHNPQRARELLRKAGWTPGSDGVLRKDGKKFSFTFTISSGSKFAERLATILKEDFAKSGIEMSVERYEWAVFIKRIQDKEFDATSLAWSLGYSSDPYQLWHSSQIKGGSNFCSFSNWEADKIIEAARREFNDDRRVALYKRFNQIIHEEQPYTFLFCNPALSVVSKRFSNVNVHTMGLKLIDWEIAETNK